MTRWLWSLAIAIPVTVAGMLPTTASADDDGWHRGQRHHRHHGYHSYHYGHGHFAPEYRYHRYRPYVQPYYDSGYYHRHYDRGEFYGVHTPWGNFYYYDD